MKFSVFSFLLFVGLSANAETKDLKKIITKATAVESEDLGRLLNQVTLVPAKDPQTGKTVFKVTKIEKGSVYEREGLKVGDLVTQ